MQHGFDPHLISIIAIFYNIAAMRYFYGTLLSERISVKSDSIAAFLRFPVLPAMGIFQRLFTRLAWRTLMQRLWCRRPGKVVPTGPNELVPANARAVLPGFAYQPVPTGVG